MIYTTLLILHVIGGGVALISGLVSMLVKKSRGLHTKAGKIYYLGMYTSSILALAMTLIKFNPFLLAIGLFTLYLVYTGKRYIDYWRKKESWHLTIFEIAPMLIGILVALFMIVEPAWQMIQHQRFFVPVLGIFGLILLINSIQDLLFIIKHSNRVPKNKKFLINHIGKMGGSYIAATTAFLVNNISFSPGWVVWMLPTFIGTFLITYSITSWRKKLRMNKA